MFIAENCNAFFLTTAAPYPLTLEFIELVPSLKQGLGLYNPNSGERRIILIILSLQCQCQLWPAIILAQHSEKPSIVHLVKSVTTYIHSVDSWTITWPLMEGGGGAVEEARRILGEEVPTVEEVEEALEEVRRKGEKNQQDYKRLCDLLCDQAETGDLHWRHYNTSLTMLCAMVRHDQVRQYI